MTTLTDDAKAEFENGWSIIQSRGFMPLAAVLDVDGNHRLRHGVDGPKEWTQIYTTVYKMCIRKPRSFAKDLYNCVQETLRQYLRSTTLPALSKLRGKESLLKELGRRWNNHKLMVKWVTRTFSYIDRYYVKRNEVPTLEHAGYMCFKNEIFDLIVVDVRKAALNIVRRERNGETVDRSLLKQVLSIFVEMGMGKSSVYTTDWETPFLEDTADFYRRTSAEWAEVDSFPDFMVKADACRVEEMERAAQYLDNQTQERLLHVYENEVLITHQQTMLNKENSGLVALLENNKYDDLQRLYRLYFRVPFGLSPVGAILKTHIQKEGMELVREYQAQHDARKNSDIAKTPTSSDVYSLSGTSQEASSLSTPTGMPANPERSDFIQSLLQLHDKYMKLVADCFSNHTVFNRSMKEAFERFVNERVGDTSTAQLFANHCDSLLNSGGRGAKMSESDVEQELDKLVKLFTYLSEKDVFQEFCRKQLAKRLLLDRSHSDDAERQLISRLKQSCGSHFTSKLEGMITDMNVSRDTQSHFHQWVAGKDQGGMSDESIAISAASGAVIGGVDFSVRVLTTGHWPTYFEDTVILPPQLSACEKMFREFYDQRTSQRVLRWVHSLGKASVETSLFVGRTPNKRLELYVSTHQLCILMLFNDADSMSYERIIEELQPKVTDGEEKSTKGDDNHGEDLIKASLVSLMAKKAPLLIKEPRGRDFNPTDVFKLNFAFVSLKRRMNIPMPTAKISEEEKEAAHETVVEDRRHAIEAAIVRVMKQYKSLEHQMLVMEVIKLCSPVFKPEPRAIKSRIEELITREYLTRSETNNSLYEYLA